MMSGDYKRIIGRLKAGEYCTAEEIKHIMGANKDLFQQQRTVSDPITHEIKQEGYVDPYRFSDSELYTILKKNNRLEKGER